MTTPLNSVTPSTGLSSADVVRLKNYIIANLTRDLESENPPYEHRHTIVQKRLTELFPRLRLNLPETIRQQIEHDVLNELLLSLIHI